MFRHAPAELTGEPSLGGRPRARSRVLFPLILSVVASLSATGVLGNEAIVFGPQTYVRGPGQPVAVKKTFRVTSPSGMACPSPSA